MKLCIAVAGAVLILSFLTELEGHDRVTTTITWNREISRIVYDRCASCHREGGGSFSLMSYAEARPWAVAIKEDVLSRRMPPWGGVKGFGEFRNDQALTAEQIEMILEWVDGGLPEGKPGDLPAAPKPSDVWSGKAPAGGLTVSGDLALTRAFKLDGLWVERLPDNASVQMIAELPDGRVEPLVWLYEYKKEYNHPFLFREPVELPARTVIRGLPTGSEVILLPPAPAEK
jgi:hypothetical protein